MNSDPLNERLWTIPNCLTMARIVLTAALHPIFFQGHSTLFLAGFCIAFATDVLDGYLARRLHLESYLGMRLDSYADYFLIASSLVWARFQLPDLFRDHWNAWLAMGVCLLIPQAIGLIKLRKNAGFHLYTTKAAGWIAFGLFLHALIAGNYSPVLFALLVAATVLKSLEETLICLIIPDPYRPVRPSFLAYRRNRQRA
ncbi:MAG: CDP-alcohol phosphatidyltransferase family protein [Candidatus Solibacter sp.]